MSPRRQPHPHSRSRHGFATSQDKSRYKKLDYPEDLSRPRPVRQPQPTGPTNFGTREMTKAVCLDCGKECEVPFKPTQGRPVYCRDCLPKHRTPRF